MVKSKKDTEYKNVKDNNQNANVRNKPKRNNRPR